MLSKSEKLILIDEFLECSNPDSRWVEMVLEYKKYLMDKDKLQEVLQSD